MAARSSTVDILTIWMRTMCRWKLRCTSQIKLSSKFNNFQQREYDYAELEKRLLNSDPVHMNMQESFAENQATGEAL